MSFDNAGFQLGRSGNEVHRALLALDVTDDVVREAEELGAELIISHHPLIFTPVKNITDCDAEHRRLLKLTAKDIAVISMHTNLDIAEGGVNDVLIRLLGAEPECALDADAAAESAHCPRKRTWKLSDRVQGCAQGKGTEILFCRSSGTQARGDGRLGR